jgi:hypothetical protein
MDTLYPDEQGNLWSEFCGQAQITISETNGTVEVNDENDVVVDATETGEFFVVISQSNDGSVEETTEFMYSVCGVDISNADIDLMAGEFGEYSIFAEGSSMEDTCEGDTFYVSEGPDFITMHDSGYLMVESSAHLVHHAGCFDIGLTLVQADGSEQTTYRTACIEADCSVQTW